MNGAFFTNEESHHATMFATALCYGRADVSALFVSESRADITVEGVVALRIPEVPARAPEQDHDPL